MKTLQVLAVCLAWFCPAIVQGEALKARHINWESDLQEAQAVRLKTNRPLLIFVSFKGCRYCTKMINETYSDQDVVRNVNGAFVPTYVDATKNQKIARALQVRVFPTTILVDRRNRIIDRIEGFATEDVLQTRLQKASHKSHAKNRSR